LSLVYAGEINIGNSPNNSILENYIKDSYLSGYVNVSFNNAPIDAKFIDNLDNNILLLDVLESSENSNFNYSCSSNCTSTYSASSPEETKTFNLLANSSKIIGFKFQENLASIDNILFEISSNALKSCENQISIDIFNDGIIDYINKQEAFSRCAEIYKGCSEISGGPSTGGLNISNLNSASQQPGQMFINAILSFFKFRTGNVIQISEIIITETPICQRIKFPQAQGYRVGAWLKEENVGTQQFNMSVYKLNGEKFDECRLSKANLPQGGSAYLDCETKFYLIKPEEFYVCLHGNSGTGKFKTRGYVPQNQSCAFQGIPPQTEIAAYDIYVQKEQFEKPKIKIENQVNSSEVLSEKIENYIIQKYKSLNCSSGCVVPIKIYSHTNQEIAIKNISVIYKGALGQTESKTIYNINEDKARINSSYQRLYLDGFFKLPVSSGQTAYNLNLSNTKVFSKSMNIENISMSLTPSIIGKGVSTKIEVFFSPNQNIKEYNWDFGEGKITTQNNSIRKIYNKTETYFIKINSKTSTNKTYFKSFLVQVVEPEIILDRIINEKAENLDRINDKIKMLEDFSGGKLKEILKIEQNKDKIEQLKKDFENAETEDKKKEIASSVIDLEIPENVEIISESEVKFSIKQENANINILSSITGEDYDNTKEEAYSKSIVNWSENVGLDISSNEIFTETNGETENIMNIYYLKFTKNNHEPYLIIKKLNDFDSTETFIEKNEYNYLKLDGNKNQLTILTTESLDIEELPLFFAPEISELQLIDEEYGNQTTTEKNKKDFGKSWIYILVGIILLIIFIFAIKHFKKPKKTINPEQKLFPDKNKLYGLISYINNAKKAGKNYLYIEKELEKAKWSKEQIKYALEKCGK
jgi:hypothetical protein